jgi:intracellular sulfur oxidation DsrE/DsrF family protein
MTSNSDRRAFLGQLGALAATMTLDRDEMRAAAHARGANETWDTSWLDRLAAARFRVVFNTSEIAEGNVLSYVDSFLSDFHTVHGTTDQQTRPVVVFRRLGTPMGFNDKIWERYAIGEDLKIRDSNTHTFATRNVYWKPRDGATGWEAEYALEPLVRRGLISLVCNVALSNWSNRMAERLKRDPEAVKSEVRENLIPGAILVPSGIYALIRAQNAGCAFMPGT